jgi:hypothetical protein
MTSQSRPRPRRLLGRAHPAPALPRGQPAPEPRAAHRRRRPAPQPHPRRALLPPQARRKQGRPGVDPVPQAAAVRRGLPPARGRRQARSRRTARRGPARARRGVTSIQRGRPDPARRHFGTATTRTRDATRDRQCREPHATGDSRCTRRRARGVNLERPTGRTTLTPTSVGADSRAPQPAIDKRRHTWEPDADGRRAAVRTFSALARRACGVANGLVGGGSQAGCSGRSRAMDVRLASGLTGCGHCTREVAVARSLSQLWEVRRWDRRGS